MKNQLRNLNALRQAVFSFSARRSLKAYKELPVFFANQKLLKQQRAAAKVDFPFAQLYPCLEDRLADGGTASGHYFHQDLLVARRIFLNNPGSHVDVGSRVDGFVAHVASFRRIKVIDIRPITSTIPNIEFVQADLMQPLKANLVGHTDSLSCLHALEHFGLGRYGDPVSYDGYLVGLDNLHKILQSGGKLYFSVPIGPQRIEFDAHRVFSVSYLLECFAGKYRIDQFSFVDDNGQLHENMLVNRDDAARNYGCHFGCGILELTKL